MQSNTWSTLSSCQYECFTQNVSVSPYLPQYALSRLRYGVLQHALHETAEPAQRDMWAHTEHREIEILLSCCDGLPASPTGPETLCQSQLYTTSWGEVT